MITSHQGVNQIQLTRDHLHFLKPQSGKCGLTTENAAFGLIAIINTYYAFSHKGIHLTNRRSKA